MPQNRLKELRKEKGYSIRDLSEEIHINRNAIQRLETNLQSLTDDYIKIFCKFFNVSPSYLLGYTDIRNNKQNEKLHDPLYIKIYNEMKDLDPETQQDIFDMVSKMKDILQKK
jgi:transcriptional regulator with XRE-family HTH domain